MDYGLRKLNINMTTELPMELEAMTWRTIFNHGETSYLQAVRFRRFSQGIPERLFEKSEEELQEILTAVSINWLAADGGLVSKR